LAGADTHNELVGIGGTGSVIGPSLEDCLSGFDGIRDAVELGQGSINRVGAIGVEVEGLAYDVV
jgi:hypothetical protein